MSMRLRALVTITALLVVAAVHWGLAMAVARLVTENYLQREGRLSQEFLDGILATEVHPEDLFTQPYPSPTLTSFAAHVRQLPGIVRANVYSPDGFIRHSTEANLVGVQFKDNIELNSAFDGQLDVKLMSSPEAGKGEHLALGDMGSGGLIEAYIPVADTSGKIVSVVEFYRKDSTIVQTRGEATGYIWLAGLANGLIVIALAWLLTRRTGRAT